ncbi:GyrI-like domain-containing protein [Clostridioides sp. ES-S-0108-01]|uniref:GyrI-like domain-containing protein n=1 Tax=Clostridioides sp. ES-S-0108-01 TaxID=2770773 RepID=UPI001D0C753D|nr:GyrI-like domain-containing protein [Clostridioides sp. ES-S-0108-01]UDN51185.1 GyrI-like domain-containing protein [Clostridioides sp. ES-S-0107-01]
MSRITDITVVEQSAYYALVIRKTINFMDEFQEFSAQGYAKIMGYVKRKNTFVAGEPIVCFHNMDLENLDIEIGFPTSTKMEGVDDIQSIEIPAQKIVTAIDQGDYLLQDSTLEELFAWIQSSPYEIIGEIYYQYLNTPNRPTNELLTKMMLPIR